MSTFPPSARPVHRTPPHLRGALSYLEPIGAVLVLQLLSVVASLGVVTAAPAVIAVRLGLRDVREGDTVVTPRTFALDTARASARWWPLCLAAVPAGVAWVLAVLFWASRPAPVSWVATGALCALGGLTLATVLGALGTATRTELAAPRAGASRDLLRRGFAATVRRPLRAAGSVVLFASWLLLVMRLPTVLLVGSAVVPALLAARLVADSDRRT